MHIAGLALTIMFGANCAELVLVVVSKNLLNLMLDSLVGLLRRGLLRSCARSSSHQEYASANDAWANDATAGMGKACLMMHVKNSMLRMTKMTVRALMIVELAFGRHHALTLRLISSVTTTPTLTYRMKMIHLGSVFI